MNNRHRTVRSIHTWLGLITGIQLLFWCTGGLVLSTHNIEWVRGNHGRDNFNTPWLIGFSVLGMLSVSSGWGIWMFLFARSRKRQPA